MNPVVKTVLPLQSWTLQKALGPVLKPSEWRAVALSFLPPPDSIVNVIMREITPLDSTALLSASARRRFRNRVKRYIEGQLCGSRMASSMRGYLLAYRQKLEAAGYTADFARVRKLRDIEAETNLYYTQLAQSHDLAETLGVDQEKEHDITTLLWEFALYGEGGCKPKLRWNSVPYSVLGIDPEQLNSLPAEDAPPLFLSHLLALLGMGDDPPDERKLLRLLKWVVRTHIPANHEPQTTPRAITNALSMGLVHRAYEVKDKETGEIEVEIEDSDATRFIRETEVKDELDRIVSRAKLSPGERLVLTGMRRGLNSKELAEWAKDHGVPITGSSVNVLASRVKAKLRAADKT